MEDAMSHTLTRRSLFAHTAAAATLVAVPAVAAAIPEQPEAQQPIVAEALAPIGPTNIDRLWKQRQVTMREYRRLQKICRKLEAEVDDQMPAPHPSIVYGPEQDASGLKPATPRIAKRHKFIEP